MLSDVPVKMTALEVCILLVFLGFSFPAFGQNLTCNDNDLRVLLDFYNSSSVLGLGNLSWDGVNSSSPSCCSWEGVACSSGGRVVGLEVVWKRLTGSLPDSLGDLDQLRTLNLSNNFFSGSIPLSLLHLPNLEVLDLSNNDFGGSFPMSVDLPSLQTFNISFNSLGGPVPVGVCANSSQLRSARMGANRFEGNVALGFSGCVGLEELCIASNNLSGGLPEDIFHLVQLSRLSVQDNRFTGNLSDKVGNLSSLSRLDVSMNDFSGVLPDVFDRLGMLDYFSAQSNRLVGGIPRSLANSPTVSYLNLRNNSLGNTIDLNCTAMVSLVSLNLATNQFSGAVPDNLPDCSRLTSLNLARNSFGGQIPESFRNFQSLSFLSFSNTSMYNLSSALETLQHCRNLSTLVLTLNFRGEMLPSDPGLQFGELKALIIANCRLTGTLPRWLSNSKKLQLLDLSWNQLDGKIPAWFGDFQFLFYLDLSNNTISGEIPIEITQLESLVHKRNSTYEPSPEFPLFSKKNVSAGGLRYNQIVSLPSTLEFGNNLLSGHIWPEFGNLKQLMCFDLKHNNFSGIIPSNLSEMTSLESLDLSHNNLSGSIPPSLAGLNFLSSFSVAYNQLSGEIPSKGQFATFSSSSFEGNQGLCGGHDSPCRGRKASSPGFFRKGNTSRRNVIGMAIGVGLGTLLVLTLVCLFILRSGRKAVDPEEVSDTFEKDQSQLGSSKVFLFQNKDNNKEISLDELVNSTNNFDQSNIIGCGGFGLVYKATLCDDRTVAIKRLSGDGGEMDREFQAEVEALSRAQHPNLVHLLGYCSYKNDRILIYSFMENGSLDYWLHEKTDGPSSLDWHIRLHIALGAARGLAYLHQSCDPHIVHRDIKSSNILLDENFEARLADFGLARLIQPYDTHITTDLVGTLGYIPPEYGQASVATYKGDVYSFGIVLLELVTGKRPMDICKPRGTRDLVSWVRQMKKEKRETEVVDPFIYDKEEVEGILRLLDIACLCLVESPKARPSAQQLVIWLDDLQSKSNLLLT